MKISQIVPDYSVSDQIYPNDIYSIKSQGFKTILCLRHDEQETNQPIFSKIAKTANNEGLITAYIPVTSGGITPKDISIFNKVYAKSPKPILAFCESGNDALVLWTLKYTPKSGLPNLLLNIKDNILKVNNTIEDTVTIKHHTECFHKIVIIGGGTAGIAVANNLTSYNLNLDIAIIDPADMHYYQSAWTMVGRGILSQKSTAHKMASTVPIGTKLINAEAKSLDPKLNRIFLSDNKVVRYEILIICPGVKLNWRAIDGLIETLGKNGVTSNYRYDLTTYTWQLVQDLKKGNAIFTQPTSPIKCTVAPQKAMYLSADYWLRQKCINNISIDFYNSESALSGLSNKKSVLKNSVRKYHVRFHLNHKLISVDGLNKLAWFDVIDADGNISTLERKYDLLHVVPPQLPPDFICSSDLLDKQGWLDVNINTLKHNIYNDIYGLGDVINLPNAKTATAARIQAKVVAMNILFDLKRGIKPPSYDGFGSLPLTIKHGEINFAEYGYADKCYLDFLNKSSQTHINNN